MVAYGHDPAADRASSFAGSADPSWKARHRRYIRRHASLVEQFPHFDLSVLSEKQLAVVEMRLCGDLSFRKIAAFEGVTHQAVMCRFVSALERLAVASDLPTRA